MKDDVEDPSVIAEIKNTVKDYSLYQFDGKSYGKGRLVLAVVKKFVFENNQVSFDDLIKAFPDKIKGGKAGVVKRLNTVSDKDKGIGGKKRYFVEADEIIKLSSGEEVVVCSQWGAGNIGKFIENATENLGYIITKE